MKMLVSMHTCLLFSNENVHDYQLYTFSDSPLFSPVRPSDPIAQDDVILEGEVMQED